MCEGCVCEGCVCEGFSGGWLVHMAGSVRGAPAKCLLITDVSRHSNTHTHSLTQSRTHTHMRSPSKPLLWLFTCFYTRCHFLAYVRSFTHRSLTQCWSLSLCISLYLSVVPPVEQQWFRTVGGYVTESELAFWPGMFTEDAYSALWKFSNVS